MKKTINILGSTGSIGTQSIEVAEKYGLGVRAISVGRNTELAKKQIELLSPEICAVADEKSGMELKDFTFGKKTKIYIGADAATEAAAADADICLNAISGFAGLRPTMTAVEHCARLAIANKETLVAAGDFVKAAVRKNNCEMIPVDSEHSAIYQCLKCGEHGEVKRLIITCSGGAFYGKTREELKEVRLSDALNHPTWNMGGKITVDCASLVNKGLEVIEAMHLFDITPDKIDVVIHRESIIHSMVEFNDNAVIAQLGSHDMRLPIQFAVTYPERVESLSEQLDFAKIGKLTFAEPDHVNFPSLKLAYAAAKEGGLTPCIFNAANEACVRLFMDGKIPFTSMYDITKKTVETMRGRKAEKIDEVYACHYEAVENAKKEAENYYLD